MTTENQIPEVKAAEVVTKLTEPDPAPIVAEEPKLEEKAPEIKEAPKAEVVEVPKVDEEAERISALMKDAANPTKSHSERIMAFVNSRKGATKIKMNDFLKSLWPLVLNQPQGHANPENMRKLRKTLQALKDNGSLGFTTDSYDRLGRPHWPDNSGKTQYHDLINTTIEVDLSQNG